ncbi:MAG: G3E family GTPase [Motiliproteus sp.]|jgi:G3E family GTPase
MNRKVPFTVIGGFLGAGKTSLINRLLREADRRYAILVNDFGSLNIDQNLIEQHSGETIALANGCICCSLAAGFSRGLGQVLDRLDDFDHVVVEASGVANPQRIQDIAKVQRQLISRGNLVVVDASQVMSQVQDPYINELVFQQIAAADFLLLNKQSLLNRSEKQLLNHFLDQISDVPRQFSDWAELAVDQVLELENNPKKLANPLQEVIENHGLCSRVITVSQPVDRAEFNRWRSCLSDDILRAKGFVYFSDCAGTWLWQKVGPQQQLDLCKETAHKHLRTEVLLISKRDIQWPEDSFSIGNVSDLA